MHNIPQSSPEKYATTIITRPWALQNCLKDCNSTFYFHIIKMLDFMGNLQILLCDHWLTHWSNPANMDSWRLQLGANFSWTAFMNIILKFITAEKLIEYWLSILLNHSTSPYRGWTLILTTMPSLIKYIQTAPLAILSPLHCDIERYSHIRSHILPKILLSNTTGWPSLLT